MFPYATRFVRCSPPIVSRTLVTSSKHTAVSSQSSPTICDLLDARVDETPHREILRVNHDDSRWSFAQLKRHSDALAFGLSDIGFRKGDVLATWMGNDAEHVCTLFAAARLGVIVAPIDLDVTVSPEGLSDVISSLQCRGVMYSDKLNGDGHAAVNSLFPLMKEQQEIWTIRDKRFPTLRSIITTDLDRTPGGDPEIENIILFKHLMLYDYYGRCPIKKTKPLLDSKIPLLLPVTSVSNGRPNPATSAYTHSDLMKMANDAVTSLKLTNTDKLCITSPSTVNPSIGILAAALAQCPLVLPVSGNNEAEAQRIATIEGANKIVANLG